MSSLVDRIARRSPFVPLVRTEDDVLELDEACASTLDSSVDDSATVALCVASVPSLVRLLLALDGRVMSVVLLSPEQDSTAVRSLAEEADCSLLVSDRLDLEGSRPPGSVLVRRPAGPNLLSLESRWILTTSGTTGRPKLVAHGMDSLTRTVHTSSALPAVWGLLYEPTRFAGLQVVLQSLLGGGTLVAPSLHSDLGSRLRFLADNGCTHLSATPTLWRRILMHPDASSIDLKQITLGGEIADDAVLGALRRAFPAARITHIYASTEAGVGFSVHDGREGFPLSYLDDPPKGVALRIKAGHLWVRPPIPPHPWKGTESVETDADGFVDSLDRVELRGDRVYFLGRDNGSVNIGGVKVQPEEVERAIYEIPAVSLVSVTSKKNPISGAILVASIVPGDNAGDVETLRADVVRHCRERLPREAVPALVKVVDSLETNAAGKLQRN